MPVVPDPPNDPSALHSGAVAGAPAQFMEIRFTESDSAGCRYERAMLDEAGKPAGKVESVRSTWEELVAHARYPAAGTVITQATITTPAGTFAARLYTVTKEREGKRFVTRAYFADKLPGAPVKHSVEVDGAPLTEMVLLSHVGSPFSPN